MVDGCRSKLVNVLSGVLLGRVMDPLLFVLYTTEPFPFWNVSWSVMLMTPLWRLLCHPQLIELQYQSPWSVTSAGLVSGVKFGEWNLNESKTKTMIISRSRTMHPESHPLTIGGTALKKFNDLVILEVTFDSKMTFDKHLHSVSRAACQRLGILRKSRRVFHDKSHFGRYFRCFVHPVLEYFSAVWCSPADTHLNYWTV